MVLRVCRSMLGVGVDADDAWSETFLAALQAWPDLPTDTRIEAWLVRVAQHKAIDITRARARRERVAAALPEAPRKVEHPGCERDELWGEVSRLPERQRLAVALHYFGGLTHVETAALIGGTPEAVRRAASDGLAALRRSYRPGKNEDGGTR